MKPGFFEGISQREIMLSSGAVKSPCCYYDASIVDATFTVSTARVAELLPDADLHPLELRKGRALLGVVVLDARRTDVGPCREVMIGPLVVFGRRPLRVLDALAAIVRRSVSVHVLHLPVTTEIARLTGVEVYGYPKTMAEIAFARSGGSVLCSVADGGNEVLRLTAAELPSHAARRMHATLYSTREGALLEAPIEINLLAPGQSFRRGAAALTLGSDHPIATSLASLDLDPRSVLLQYSPLAELILYAPHPAHVPMARAG